MKPSTLLPLLCALVSLSAVSARAGTLWRTDLEAADLAGRAVYSSSGAVTVSSSYGAVGTILSVGTNTASRGIALAVDSSAATGAWTAGMTTGVVALTTPNTTITNLGLVTLSFSLRASTPHPIIVRVESYDASNNRTGGLRTLIYPATAAYYQRFALDLSTMTADGAGVFNPTDPKIAVSLELDSAAGGDGWPNAAGLTLNVDNLNYATPAYYVKPAASGGSDSNTAGAGTTEANAFATPNFAVGKAAAGDIVVVKAGIYIGGINFGAKAGLPDAWVVLRNYPGEVPVVRHTQWNAVYIGAGSSTNRYTGPGPAYIEVRGMTVRGYSLVDASGDRSLDPYNNATLLAKLGVYGETNTNGITVEGRFMDALPHDFRIADCVVENNSGGGISSLRGDRVLVENNVVRNNCWWMIYAGSGISFLVSADFETNSDYRSVIQGNQCYSNETMVPWVSHGDFSDGNGIIVDSNRNSDYQSTIPYGPYQGRTLVQENLTYNNGGSGIHSYASQNVDIIHNTAYLNSASPHLAYSQLYAGNSKNVQMRANILVAPTNITGSPTFNEPVSSNSNADPASVYFQNNLYFGGDTPPSTTGNYSGNNNADPKFIAASIDPANANFLLRATSPGRNAAAALPGTAAPSLFRSGLDVARRPRPTGTADQGAYQTQGGEDSAPFLTPAAGNYPAAQNVTLATDLAGAKVIYTVNGATPTVDASGNPTNGSLLYTAGTPVSISVNPTTLKAIAWKAGSPANFLSPVTGGTYTLNNLASTPIPDLIFFPPGGTFTTTQTVAVICRTPGALVRYTLDGTVPSATTGTLLPQKMLAVAPGKTLKAIAYLPGRANSPLHSEDYNAVPVVNDPAITVSPTSLGRVLPPTATVGNTFTINNPSPIPHTYTLSMRGVGAATSFSVSKSTDPGGPLFSWQDISAAGTVISALDGADDTNTGPFTLNFTFPFYGTDFTNVRVCSNGFLSFTDSTNAYTNLALPSTSAPKNLVAMFWDDLYLRATPTPVAHAYYRNPANGPFVTQFSDLSSYDDSAARLTAQAILKPGGEITFQYLNDSIPDAHNYTIGTQNSTGAIGQTIAYNLPANSPYVTTAFAVRLTPQGPAANWLNVLAPTTTTVSVPANSSVAVNVQLASNGLAAGTYNANVQVSSDSALHPLTLVPVSLTVANTITNAQWQALWFTSAQMSNPLISGPLADPDGDGVNNLLERSMGRSPTTAQPFAPLGTTQLDGSGRLALTFTRDTTAGDLTYTVLASNDLVAWTPIASSTNGAATVSLNNLAAAVAESSGTVRAVTVTDASTTSPRFLRLEVKSP